jgi:hypothetical protein
MSLYPLRGLQLGDAYANKVGYREKQFLEPAEVYWDHGYFSGDK